MSPCSSCCCPSIFKRPRHTIRQIVATRRRDRLLQQIAPCDIWKWLSLRSIARIQTGLNSCDISQRPNKLKALSQQQCRRGDLSPQRVAAICRIVCLGLKFTSPARICDVTMLHTWIWRGCHINVTEIMVVFYWLFPAFIYLLFCPFRWFRFVLSGFSTICTYTTWPSSTSLVLYVNIREFYYYLIETTYLGK